MRDLSPKCLPHADGVNQPTRRWFAAPTRAFGLIWGAPAHLLENARALSDFDEVAVRIAQVTANVHLMILGRAQELAAAVAPPLRRGSLAS